MSLCVRLETLKQENMSIDYCGEYQRGKKRMDITNPPAELIVSAMPKTNCVLAFTPRLYLQSNESQVMVYKTSLSIVTTYQHGRL